MLGLCVVMAMACNDKDTGDSDIGTEADTEAPLASVSVTGAVSGLFNGAAALQLNGAGDVSIGEDGTFSFDDALFEGDDFDVTVLTQPPGQSCDVVGGSGTAQADITDVQVVCGCDFSAALRDERIVPSVLINDVNALNFNAVTPLRGFEATLDWVVSCGSVNHTLFRSGETAPDLEDSTLDGGVIAETFPEAWSGSTAWSLVGIQDISRRGRLTTPALYRASPPSWEPEAVLYPGAVVGSVTVLSNRSADVGSDGVVVGLVVVEDGSNERLAVAKVDGDVLSIAFDSADGVDIDGVSQAVCNVGDPVWSADGHMAVPVTYGNSCLARGFSDFFGGLLVVSDGEAPRLVLGDTDVDPVAGRLYQISDVAVDDTGHATLREWRCPDGQRCVRPEGGTELVQVDLETGDSEVVVRFGGIYTAGVTVTAINTFDVALTGEVALHVDTEDAACRRGGCPTNERAAWWDGELQNSLTSGEELSGYTVNRAIRTVSATTSGRMGVLAALYETQPTNNGHDAFVCWDAEGGSAVALGRPTNGETELVVDTVLSASLNDDGNFAATVTEDGGSGARMLLGSCP